MQNLRTWIYYVCITCVFVPVMSKKKLWLLAFYDIHFKVVSNRLACLLNLSWLQFSHSVNKAKTTTTQKTRIKYMMSRILRVRFNLSLYVEYTKRKSIAKLNL